MIKYHLQNGDRILIVQPTGPLTQEDFENLAKAIEPVTASGGIDGLVIDAPKFPGWQNFAGLVSHIRFVKDHHRKIGRVAIVSDGKALRVLPKFARHFVKAELRQFSQEKREEAVAWASGEPTLPESAPASLRYFQNEDPPAFWIGVNGRVTREDYLKLLVPIKAQIAEQKPVSMLVQMEKSEGMEVGAMWEDLKFGVGNIKHIRRMAIVTDKKWVDVITNLMDPLFAAEMRTFPTEQESDAWEWVIEADQ